jgi:hypothetical protein
VAAFPLKLGQEALSRPTASWAEQRLVGRTSSGLQQARRMQFRG